MDNPQLQALVHKLIPSRPQSPGSRRRRDFTHVKTIHPASRYYSGANDAPGFERATSRQGSLGYRSRAPTTNYSTTPQDEVAFNQALLRGVSTEYRSHPELLATCAAKNLFFNFWFLGKRPQSTLLNVVVQAPLLGLALAGAVILWKRGLLRKAGIVLLYILYIPAVQAPIIAHARHSMFIVPFLAILGAVSLVSAWRALRMQNSGAPEQQTVRATSGV